MLLRRFCAMSSTRKIVKAELQPWEGLWTGAEYGVRVTFDDGAIIGMAIGLKE
jgi:hypothetical protein